MNDGIEARAADWLARQDRDGFTTAEGAELEVWLDADTRHRVAYLRLRAAWGRADRLAALRPAEPARAGARRGGQARRGLVLPPAVVTRPVIAAAVAVAALLVVAPLGVMRLSQDVYETSLGGRSVTPLSDGSRIELNSDTQVKADIGGDERTVWLTRGEAYFDVAHDGRPFVVRSEEGRVVVEGTKFSVRRDGKSLLVRVSEGRVRVETAKTAAQRLGPGQQARVGRGKVEVSTPGLATIAEEMSWRDGRLQFRQASLAEVAEAFNRYNRTRLIVADPETAALQIGGSFEAADVEAFADVLRAAYGLEIKRRDGAIIISHPRTGS